MTSKIDLIHHGYANPLNRVEWGLKFLWDLFNGKTSIQEKTRLHF